MPEKTPMSFYENARLLIDGKLVAASGGRTFENINPATEEVLGLVPDASVEDAERAIAAARRAFDESDWATNHALRARCLRQLRDGLQERLEELRKITVAEVGCPIQMTAGPGLDDPVKWLGDYADYLEKFEWRLDAGVAEVMGNRTQRWIYREPIGVLGAITPWNVPNDINLKKLGWAMAAGCTVVMKAAPSTSWCANFLGEVIATKTDVPAGAVNILSTSNNDVGEKITNDRRVDIIGFTGSTAVGKRILEVCASQVKPALLELGGKSAAILLDDFDASASTEALIGAGTLNNGQACAAQTRILAPRARYSEITEALAATLGAMKVGDNMDPETRIGPLVAERQRDRVAGMLARAKAAGARALCGGGRPAGLDRGWFIEPTLFTEVDNTMEIAREEIFGPVLVAIPYDDEDHAVAIANDSPFGLGGGIWTEDSERGAAIATRLRTGAITINHAMLLDFNCPFGGFKRSGLGRELGAEGIDSYVELQSIIFPLAGQAAASE
jgi:aldehyde dehydrogenase (NAD+)